jgi:uncharacterized protein (DUF1778 family)
MCTGRIAVPRVAIEDNSRIALRILPAHKAKIIRAAALEKTDLTNFLLQHALRAAESVIEKAERVALSERDSMRVLDLLENPPAPNARLVRAAQALPPDE